MRDSPSNTNKKFPNSHFCSFYFPQTAPCANYIEKQKKCNKKATDTYKKIYENIPRKRKTLIGLFFRFTYIIFAY